MADSAPDIDRPPRDVSPLTLGLRLATLDFSRQLKSRKTLILFLIQFLPALVATLAFFWGDPDGLGIFEGTVERVYLPMMLPLAALFFGGPTIVDEVEAKTITYLTLRPMSRTTLLLGKLASSITLALGVTVIPIVIFFVICAVGGTAPIGDGLPILGSAVGTVAVGAVTYTSIFALLGVIFSSTLLPGIVYYVVFEMILGTIPVIEVLSVKFHLYVVGGFQRSDEEAGAIRQSLEQMLLDRPMEFDWWVGLAVCGIATAAAVTVAAVLFKDRQFHL